MGGRREEDRGLFSSSPTMEEGGGEAGEEQAGTGQAGVRRRNRPSLLPPMYIQACHTLLSLPFWSTSYHPAGTGSPAAIATSALLREDTILHAFSPSPPPYSSRSTMPALQFCRNSVLTYPFWLLPATTNARAPYALCVSMAWMSYRSAWQLYITRKRTRGGMLFLPLCLSPRLLARARARIKPYCCGTSPAAFLPFLLRHGGRLTSDLSADILPRAIPTMPHIFSPLYLPALPSWVPHALLSAMPSLPITASVRAARAPVEQAGHYYLPRGSAHGGFTRFILPSPVVGDACAHALLPLPARACFAHFLHCHHTRLCGLSCTHTPGLPTCSIPPLISLCSVWDTHLPPGWGCLLSLQMCCTHACLYYSLPTSPPSLSHTHHYTFCIFSPNRQTRQGQDQVFWEQEGKGEDWWGTAQDRLCLCF